MRLRMRCEGKIIIYSFLFAPTKQSEKVQGASARFPYASDNFAIVLDAKVRVHEPCLGKVHSKKRRDGWKAFIKLTIA